MSGPLSLSRSSRAPAFEFDRRAGQYPRMISGIGKSRSLIALSLLLAAGGCSRLRSADLALRDAGIAERCVDLMQRAFPDADITVTKRDVTLNTEADSMAAAVARIEGVREKVPEGQFITRVVGVECRFENEILVGFRWTAGPFR
jgi:hypothetical protein